MERIMRPYQAKGKQDIFTEWDRSRILMFVLATGGGKTFTFTEVIREFLNVGKRCMLIAHREELINQSWQTLYDAGIASGIIQADHPTDYSLRSQVCSIQTIIRRRKLPDTDLIVIDEGHHVTDDNSYAKIIKLYPNAKVLIVTATPYRLSGDGFLNILKEEQTKLIINATNKDLIDDGWLVPLKYMVGSTPDMSTVQLIKGEYEEEGTAKAMSLAPIVESYIEHTNGMQGICFCVNVAHSKEVCAKYNAAGIKAVHIDANTPKDARREALAAFKRGEVKVACNVGIFTEGTDFPNAQFVQLAAPTKSLSKYMQEVGRVTRALPGTVDKWPTAEERRAAIAGSGKPYGIILDNAGMWREHPFPDDDIDWQLYFNGWKSQKKKKTDEEPEYIEIPVYEVEDPKTGARRKTKNIDEVNGMVLIEVTSETRRNIKSIKHLKEFDRLYKVGLEFYGGKIQKPGYFAYYKFYEYCMKNNITMEDIVWKYMREVLCDNIDNEINEYLENARSKGENVHVRLNAKLNEIRMRGVHVAFLRKEWEGYKQGVRRMSSIITK